MEVMTSGEEHARDHTHPKADIAVGIESSKLDPHSADFDYGTWLQHTLQGAGGCYRRATGIAYQNLNVYGFGTQTDYQKTFANYPLAYLLRLRSFLGQQRKLRIDILRDFHGLVRSGEMLLVLGRPGSGCSTFLKTLAGETDGLHLDTESRFNYQGEIERA